MNAGAMRLSQGAEDNLQLSNDWIKTVLNELDKNSPAYKAVTTARESGNLMTVVAGVNRNTGQIIFLPVKLP